MAGKSRDGLSKRPRMDNLVEEDDIRNRVRELEEENKRMKEVESENKEFREAMEELRGMVECPVCLLLPKHGGPLPVCSNGHFVCHKCRDRIRQEVDGVGEAKCPSCMVVLGNATSLLASRVIERVKHECEHDGCEEKIRFADLEKHKLVCLFRKVLCPAGGTCEIELAFNRVEEHIKVCGNFNKVVSKNEITYVQALNKDIIERKEEIAWRTKMITASGKSFFLRSERESFSHYFDVTMLGSEEECSEFLASTTILDKNGKVFTTNICRPTPISLDEWGDMGLVVSEKVLSRIWRTEDQTFAYDVKVSVAKV